MSRLWRDPAAPSLALFAGLVVCGFVVTGLGWRVAAATAFVPAQLAAMMSGGVVGVALVVIGATLTVVQVGRRMAAAEAQATDALLDEARLLLDGLAEEVRS